MAKNLYAFSYEKKEKRHAKNKKELKSLKAKDWKSKKGSFVVTKSLLKWQQYENKVRALFTSLNFEDTIKRSYYYAGKYQIDAGGGEDETYIYVDCVVKGEPGGKNIKSKIKSLTADRKEIADEINNKFGKTYKNFIFAISTQDINVRPADAKYAKAKNTVILKESQIDYYIHHYKLIGPAFKYQFLRDLGVPICLDLKSIDLPAFEVQTGQRAFYAFLMEAEELLKFAYVLRAGTEKKEAYQRLLSKAKLESVSKFIDEGGFFVNNIIITFDPEIDVKFVPKKVDLKLHKGVRIGTLSIPPTYSSAWIIDGQHRLYGYLNTNKKHHLLNVVAFKKLDENEQAKLFVDINTNAKKVDTNLLWDLNSDIKPNTEVGNISRLVKEMSRSGPLKNKIFVPRYGGPKNYLNIANVSKSIKDQKLLSLISSTLPQKDYSGRANLCEERLNAYIKKILEFDIKKGWKEDFVLTNNGFNIIVRLFRKMLDSGRIKTSDYNILERPLRKYFSKQTIRAVRRRASSEGERGEITKEILALTKL